MKRKKIVLFGATGMAGHVAYFYLKATGKYEITNVVYRTKLNDESIILDITDKEATEALILSLQPDILLNCVGVLIKGSQEFPDNAIYINAYFPHLLERIASSINAKLIHISTDCVFSGKKGNYEESDERDADDVYGKSKGLGEVINDKDLTIRTSIIGPELKQNGEGLFHWFMKQNGVINGFSKAFWSGVTTYELAKAIDAIIEQNITGLLHLTNGEKITKYDLLSLFKEIWKVDKVQINLIEGKSVDKSLNSTIKNFKYKVPSYREMILSQKEFTNDYKELYTQYQ
ncbi:MAG: SDR family oxidoreductase [Flavobacteriaceae bacterium]|nr:SDR family oxidoreductase [Flavobacteriaceae bacterium]